MDREEQEELKRQLKTRDRAVRCISENGNFRIAAVKNTQTARTAQERHGLPVVGAFLLARQLTSASLIAAFLKGEERIITEATGNGAIQKVYAEAMHIGEVRGHVNFNPDMDEAVITHVSDALADGNYKVSRILYDKKEPVTGIVPLQKGDIATDLAAYFASSEQIPSAVVLDADFDENEKIKSSGGILVQAMPGASDEEIEEVYDSLTKAENLREYFEKDYTPVDILKEVLPFDFKVLTSSQIDFLCRCSKEGFIDKLKTLKLEDIEEMRALNQNELICHYCNAHYHLNPEDFEMLEEELQAKEN